MKPYKIENIEASREEKLKQLNEVLNKQYASTNLKINHIRNTFNCICTSCRSQTFNFPARCVIYQLSGIQKIETYRMHCFKKAGYKDTNKPKKRSKK
jgi:hypothetical protein